MEFNFETPINSLGLGQVGFGLLLEMYKRGLRPNLFPIGNIDLSAFDLPEGMGDYINRCASGAIKNIGKKLPSVRWWHIHASHSLLPSNKNILYSVHETSEITEVERNICNLYDTVLLPSRYSREVFERGGVKTKYCPNFFDSHHFKKIETQKQEGVINFCLLGKLEKRKLTHEILATWAQKFGGNPAYRLHAILHNPFLPPDVQQRSIDGIFKGHVPFNINLIPYQQKNAAINELINFSDIGISLSGAEGFDLPAINYLGLGKQHVVLNAHAHKDYCTAENSILVEPNDIRDIFDGVFFIKGSDYNQGNQFTFDPKDAIGAMELAVDRVKNGIINTEGEKVKGDFSVARTLDIILEELQ